MAKAAVIRTNAKKRIEVFEIPARRIKGKPRSLLDFQKALSSKAARAEESSIMSAKVQRGLAAGTIVFQKTPLRGKREILEYSNLLAKTARAALKIGESEVAYPVSGKKVSPRVMLAWASVLRNAVRVK